VLRGVQEQHNLLLTQLERIPPDYTVYTTDDVHYIYTDYVSKNNLHKFANKQRTRLFDAMLNLVQIVAWFSC
jgi:hypothetical protein